VREQVSAETPLDATTQDRYKINLNTAAIASVGLTDGRRLGAKSTAKTAIIVGMELLIAGKPVMGKQHSPELHARTLYFLTKLGSAPTARASPTPSPPPQQTTAFAIAQKTQGQTVLTAIIFSILRTIMLVVLMNPVSLAIARTPTPKIQTWMGLKINALWNYVVIR
jgi:hypothetical protein